MKAITSTWFECIVAFDKTQDDGTSKRVTETYTVDALTFTEAESTIIEEMKSYISGEFNIKNINPALYRELFFSDSDKDDRWFRMKLAFITFDEKTQKEKQTNVIYLVQAQNADMANFHVKEIMAQSMMDYRIVASIETKILDVFVHR